jgi:formyl-CoA transferase
LEPRQGNHSVVLLALNHNKTSIALDYRSAAGQEVVQWLARSADTLLYDAHPKHARSLGLDYATLAAENPQLIYGLRTPCGEHGPWANRVASEV